MLFNFVLYPFEERDAATTETFTLATRIADG